MPDDARTTENDRNIKFNRKERRDLSVTNKRRTTYKTINARTFILRATRLDIIPLAPALLSAPCSHGRLRHDLRRDWSENDSMKFPN